MTVMQFFLLVLGLAACYHTGKAMGRLESEVEFATWRAAAEAEYEKVRRGLT